MEKVDLEKVELTQKSTSAKCWEARVWQRTYISIVGSRESSSESKVGSTVAAVEQSRSLRHFRVWRTTMAKTGSTGSGGVT